MEEGGAFDSDWIEEYFAENPAIPTPTVQHGIARKRPYSELSSSEGGTQTTRDVDISARKRPYSKLSSSEGGTQTTRDVDVSAEEKQLRRKKANRQSARRSRQNKGELIDKLQQTIATMHLEKGGLEEKCEALARKNEQVLAKNMIRNAQIKEMHVLYEDLKEKYEELARNYKQVLAENMTFKAQTKEMHVAYEDPKAKYEALAPNYEQVFAENMTFKAQEKRNKDGEKMSTPMPTNLNHIQESACGEQSYLDLLQIDDLDIFDLETICDWSI